MGPTIFFEVIMYAWAFLKIVKAFSLVKANIGYRFVGTFLKEPITTKTIQRIWRKLPIVDNNA
jgi:hypothetical protein